MIAMMPSPPLWAVRLNSPAGIMHPADTTLIHSAVFPPVVLHGTHEGTAVEFVLSLDDTHQLASGEHPQELLVILLLDFLQLDVNFILLLDGLQTRCIIISIDEAVLPHLIKEGMLLALHLLEKREESGSLLR